MCNESESHHELIVDSTDAGTRLDLFLTGKFPAFSRAKLRRIIDAGDVLVDGRKRKSSFRLSNQHQVSIDLPEVEENEGPVPEDIPLDFLYEDEHLAVVNKPPRMVVHPAKGHWAGTLTSALAFHLQQLSTVGGPTRPGIVHRLDRDTSGVIIVAKNDEAHIKLAAQFEARTTEKEYDTIVSPAPDRDRDIINAPIGRHQYQREKMAIRENHSTSRDAETFFEVIERFEGFALLRVRPKTGRTHQIRVHLTHQGYSVLCDPLYSGRATIRESDFDRHAQSNEVVLDRQALHAHRLKLTHPATGKPIEFIAPLPEDLDRTLVALRKYRSL